MRFERRDIAVTAAPGMGLTTFLSSLSEDHPVAWLDVQMLKDYWDKEYSGRENNRRFVIHAAALRSLMNALLLPKEMDDAELYKTNLAKALSEVPCQFDEERPALIVIDDFDEAPVDLALLVCKEMKAIDDLRQQERGKSLRSIRFVIGGAIDFAHIFAGELQTGVSPATNFCKYRPYHLLFSEQETADVLDADFPALAKLSPSMPRFVYDCTWGYIHYVTRLAAWILDEGKEVGICEDIRLLLLHLRESITEQNALPLFDYCYSGWEFAKSDASLVDVLSVAVSAGHVLDSSGKARRLSLAGLLLEKPTEPNLYQPANALVELLLRQKLSELGKLLPIGDSTARVEFSLNMQAYAILLNVETRLRTFIGDQLFGGYKAEWVKEGLKDIDSSGTPLLEKVRERQRQDQDSPYATYTTPDSILAHLDFPDLGQIVEQRKGLFTKNYSQFVEMLPSFLSELNYYRRRIAHTRPIAQAQITALENRWRILNRMISRQK